ncbi:TlpA disulfide reductase family protein [uncultured Georgenia sp.]|uniref:TlpA family protein disulfide reductase n=1 Tax=uncultured Georgenia sp. TaxID=378209 RepID=UPI0026043696|nr:TlpA disulfide reductase family protein [uncultured Georgenia sp.]HLV04830.1 TlpA disulfide reductase family protein [Actinomycetaceae bacterium]
MNRLTRALATLAVAVVVLTGCGGSTGGTATDTTGAGYQAGDGSWTTWDQPDRTGPVELTGTTYDDEEVDLADWRGDVVVLNYWYAACPPCRAEAGDLAAIHADYADQGVRLLGINPRDDAATAQAFERSFDVPYPSLHDETARGVAALQGLVPLQAMPTTVVLDTEGRVAGRVLGQIDPGVVRGMIDDVLAEAAR